MIRFRHKGDFSKLTRFLERAKETVHLGDLDKFGREGVAALASATPVDSGETAASWYYKITNRDNTVTIFKMEFPLPLSCNTDMALGPEAGYREEITSTLLSSLFLTRSQITHGRRSHGHEQDHRRENRRDAI